MKEEQTLFYQEVVVSTLVTNCTIYNNTASQFGVGLDISLSLDGYIEFDNCNIYNYTAQLQGGGVEILLKGGGSIEFLLINLHSGT